MWAVAKGSAGAGGASETTVFGPVVCNWILGLYVILKLNLLIIIYYTTSTVDPAQSSQSIAHILDKRLPQQHLFPFPKDSGEIVSLQFHPRIHFLAEFCTENCDVQLQAWNGISVSLPALPCSVALTQESLNLSTFYLFLRWGGSVQQQPPPTAPPLFMVPAQESKP